MKEFRSGHVRIIGKPNVGKSTLLNQLIDQKISIVSRKPQTTRWNINGIKTSNNYQIIFIDTPGLQINPKFTLNRYMNKEVSNLFFLQNPVKEILIENLVLIIKFLICLRTLNLE